MTTPPSEAAIAVGDCVTYPGGTGRVLGSTVVVGRPDIRFLQIRDMGGEMLDLDARRCTKLVTSDPRHTGPLPSTDTTP